MTSVIFDDFPTGFTSKGTYFFRNSALLGSGGAIYLAQSNLHFSAIFTNISDNVAGMTGGGVYANDSLIFIDGTVHFGSNRANAGGGVSLANTQFYSTMSNEATISNINFVLDQAFEYRGALYVNDGRIKSTCQISGQSANDVFLEYQH